MKNKLYCGAARERITPPAQLLPGLYGLMGQRFGGVLDELYVRVIALRNDSDKAVLVSFDLDKAPYPKEWIALLSQRLDVPEENILYTATHTHTAPLTDPRPLDGPNAKSVHSPEEQAATDEYEALVCAALMRAADAAVATMRPALFGFTCGESYVGVSRNWDYSDGCGTGHNGAGDVDRCLLAAGFLDTDGAPIAYLLNLAVHNCIMLGNKMFGQRAAVSSDMSGAVSERLERAWPGCVAMWTSGAAGDVNPILMNQVYSPDIEDGSFRVDMLSGDETLLLRAMSGRQYADVRRTLGALQCMAATADISAAVRWVKTPGIGADYELRVHGLRIGGLALCGFSGELYTSFGRQVKALSPFEVTAVVNHDATFLSNADYILDDDGCRRGALGYSHSFMRPGYMKDALNEALPILFSQLK